MALVPCRDCGESMSTSARACPRCGAVNRGLRGGRWIAPDDDPVVFERGPVRVAGQHWAVGDAVYPLYLVSRVVRWERPARPYPRFRDGETGLGVMAILLSGIVLFFLAYLGTEDRDFTLSGLRVPIVLCVAVMAAGIAWLCFHFRRVPLLYAVDVGDEVGGEMRVLDWTPEEEDATATARELARAAGLEWQQRR